MAEVSVGQQALYAILTLVLMFGMGCTLPAAAFRGVMARPRALLTGMACQFGALPLLGLLAATGLSLEATDALGLLLMVTAGGGNASNMLTYLARADVALSLSMTGLSAIASVVLTPLLLSLYATQLPPGAAQPPLSAVALTVGLMAVPVPLGMWLRARAPALAARVDRAGRWAGFALLVVILATGLADQVRLLADAPWQVLGACGLVSGGGMAVGGTAGRLAGLSRPTWLAIAFETGVQNLPAVLAVIALAFPVHQQGGLQRVPLLYATVALTLGTALWLSGRPRTSAR